MKSFIILGMVFFTQQAACQQQGIKGEVLWLSGNQMPGPGKLTKPKKGIVREILVYNAVRLQDVEQTNGFFSSIKTDLVAKTKSDSKGCFKIKLPPGQYSVFIKEPQGLYANLYNQDGQLNYIEVKPKQYSTLTITVDYEAAY